MSGVTIIIPTFNEEDKIKETLNIIKDRYKDYEIIMIDDGSTDATYNIASLIDGIKIIRHPYNKGYGASIKTGIKNANGDIVVTIDSDGQHNPEDIERLITYIGEYDMVVGNRTQKIHTELWRMPGKWFLGKLANYLMRKQIPDLNSGLRAFKKDVILKYLHICPDGFSLSTVSTLALFSEGYNVKYIPINVNKREGKSSVTVRTGLETVLLITRIVTLFNPLRIFLPISFVIGGFGILYLLFDLIDGNIADTSILSILISALIFFFGLMCDQMAHIRRELKG